MCCCIQMIIVFMGDSIIGWKFRRWNGTTDNFANITINAFHKSKVNKCACEWMNWMKIIMYVLIHFCVVSSTGVTTVAAPLMNLIWKWERKRDKTHISTITLTPCVSSVHQNHHQNIPVWFAFYIHLFPGGWCLLRRVSTSNHNIMWK